MNMALLYVVPCLLNGTIYLLSQNQKYDKNARFDNPPKGFEPLGGLISKKIKIATISI